MLRQPAVQSNPYVENGLGGGRDLILTDLDGMQAETLANDSGC